MRPATLPLHPACIFRLRNAPLHYLSIDIRNLGSYRQRPTKRGRWTAPTASSSDTSSYRVQEQWRSQGLGDRFDNRSSHLRIRPPNFSCRSLLLRRPDLFDETARRRDWFSFLRALFAP